MLLIDNKITRTDSGASPLRGDRAFRLYLFLIREKGYRFNPLRGSPLPHYDNAGRIAVFIVAEFQ